MGCKSIYIRLNNYLSISISWVLETGGREGSRKRLRENNTPI